MTSPRGCSPCSWDKLCDKNNLEQKGLFRLTVWVTYQQGHHSHGSMTPSQSKIHNDRDVTAMGAWVPSWCSATRKQRDINPDVQFSVSFLFQADLSSWGSATPFSWVLSDLFSFSRNILTKTLRSCVKLRNLTKLERRLTVTLASKNKS